MGPEGIILVNPPITTLQQSLTHSALVGKDLQYLILEVFLVAAFLTLAFFT